MKVAFTQTKEYLKWQESVGGKTFYKEFDYAIVASVILELKIGKVLYCPFGPVFLGGENENIKKDVFKYLKGLGEKENCVFVRTEKAIEPGLMDYKKIKGLFSPPIKTYNKEGVFQPRLEWCLNLKKSEEEIYNDFSKNCKYSIRRSEKENIKVEIVFDNFENYLSDFLKIMKETSGRNNFVDHEDKYYMSVFESLNCTREPSPLGKKMKGFLVVSTIDEIVVNMSVILLDQNETGANYVFGGSRDYKREFGATFRTQWEAMKFAKSLGATEYNFGGITGEFEGNVFGRETLQGVTNFKKQFAGYPKFNGYFYDIPIKKFKYFTYLIYKMFRSII